MFGWNSRAFHPPVIRIEKEIVRRLHRRIHVGDVEGRRVLVLRRWSSDFSLRLRDWTRGWRRTFLRRNFPGGLDIRWWGGGGERRRFLWLGLPKRGCSRQHA